jgi:hypothetical protein
VPAKRPTKRKLEPVTDKVMREAAPRQAVTRVSRDEEAPPPASALDATVDDDLDDAEVGGKATTPDLADDAASAGTRARRKAQEEQAAASTKKRRRKNKRVTEKGGPGASTRYTPKAVHYEDMPSPMWVPVLMFAMWILGMLSIILNYMGLLPGGTSNWYLLLGLGFILAGIITATQYR